jgi:hypothetical protein
MLGSHEDLYSEAEPIQEQIPIRVRLQKLVGVLAPGQRLVLSVFLFMDVCILCFVCLFLFKKIALPF